MPCRRRSPMPHPAHGADVVPHAEAYPLTLTVPACNRAAIFALRAWCHGSARRRSPYFRCRVGGRWPFVVRTLYTNARGPNVLGDAGGHVGSPLRAPWVSKNSGLMSAGPAADQCRRPFTASLTCSVDGVELLLADQRRRPRPADLRVHAHALTRRRTSDEGGHRSSR